MNCCAAIAADTSLSVIEKIRANHPGALPPLAGLRQSFPAHLRRLRVIPRICFILCRSTTEAASEVQVTPLGPRHFRSDSLALRSKAELTFSIPGAPCSRKDLRLDSAELEDSFQRRAR